MIKPSTNGFRPAAGQFSQISPPVRLSPVIVPIVLSVQNRGLIEIEDLPERRRNQTDPVIMHHCLRSDRGTQIRQGAIEQQRAAAGDILNQKTAEGNCFRMQPLIAEAGIVQPGQVPVDHLFVRKEQKRKISPPFLFLFSKPSERF